MNKLSVLKLHVTSLYALFMLARHTDNVRYVFMIGNAQDSLAEGARVRSVRAPAPLRSGAAVRSRRGGPAVRLGVRVCPRLVAVGVPAERRDEGTSGDDEHGGCWQNEPRSTTHCGEA